MILQRFFGKNRPRGGGRWFSTLLLVLIAAGFFFGGALMLWFSTLEIPSLDSFHTRRVAESTKIYDRTGNVLLYDVHGNIRRTIVPLDQISPTMQNAIIAIEDPEFYNHMGIKPTAIVRAVLANIQIFLGLSDGYLQGGSTITQQVLKNTVLTTEQTIPRKVKEWVLALKLEKVMDKKQILEVYMNETPWGGTIYGIEEASKYYFGKHANELSLPEAAYLAALPQAPTYYSPYGNHREDLEARKNLVLQEMVESGFITQAEADEAAAAEVEFVMQEGEGIKAPHFVFYVREYLEQKYGVTAVAEQGLKVITTLDWELQQQAEEIVRKHALTNERNYNAENAGLVAIDPQTGHILAMVGSRGYFDEDIDGKVNVTLAKRQPGSSFKPFIYATAFAKGYTPETILFNLRTQFSTACAPNFLETTDTCYAPVNYDAQYNGPMSLRHALAQSVNVPAVKLLYLVGINDALETARRMGITTLGDAARYGLTLVLGGGEVRLLDMVSAYSIFATDGIRHPHTPILRIEDPRGNALEEFTLQEQRVLDEQVARQVSDVLSDDVARAPAFGEGSLLNVPGFDVAVKTGTTNDYKDAWIVGYTPSLAVGAWAGNNDATSMEKRVAGFIIAPLWNEFMQVALPKMQQVVFNPPEPTPQNIPPILRGSWNNPGSDGRLHSILYWVNKQNPRSGQPSNPYSDSQFNLWEYPVSVWSGAQASSTPSTNDIFSMTNISTGSVVPPNVPVPVQIVSARMHEIQNVTYFLNEQPIGTVNSAPFSVLVTPTTEGPATLRATATGSFGTASHSVIFLVQ